MPAASGPIRVLLTGDVEPEAQSVVMAGPPPEAQVVKVPHHGSRYQVPRFAQWSGARIALFSVGRDNDYGHPSESTLHQYRGAGARIGRTDQQGDLAVVPVAGGLALVVPPVTRRDQPALTGQSTRPGAARRCHPDVGC